MLRFKVIAILYTTQTKSH